MLQKILIVLNVILVSACATIYRNRELLPADKSQNKFHQIAAKNLVVEVKPPGFLPNDILIGPLVPILPTYPIDAYFFDVNRFIRKPSMVISFKNMTQDYIEIDLSDWKIRIDENEELKPCELSQGMRSKIEVEKNIQWGHQKISDSGLHHSISPGESSVSLSYCRNSTRPGKTWTIEIPKLKILNTVTESKKLSYNFIDTYHFDLFRISK